MEISKQTAIIYSSRYGSVKQYAVWLTEQRECDMITAREAKLTMLRPYQTIIWMGSVHEGNIDGIETLSKLHSKLRERRIAIFAVGAAPDASEVRLPGELAALPFYYARGRWNPSELKGKDQMMLKMLRMLASKKPESVNSWLKDLLKNDEKYDFMDPLYLDPVLDFIDGRA